MQAALRIVGAMVLAGLLGLAVGLGAGWLTLGRETAVPDELRQILEDTAADNAATLAAIQSWRNANPPLPTL